jgi:2'-hydroxyisoflavone reductase
VTNRRDFLHYAAALGGTLAYAPFERLYQGLPDVEAAPRALRILILGGTGQTGPLQVHYAVARGHQVTVFNRQRRQTELPRSVVRIKGDRNLHEMIELKGKTWDVVIDNPTTLPFWVKDAAEVLKGNVNQYVFISTISVYNPKGQTRIEENSPLFEYSGDPLAVTPEQLRAKFGDLYGPMKVASEREAKKWFGEKTTIIRPGLIVGPRDETDRFTYWPIRVDRGGEILAPGDGTDPIQIIDGRDLAEWTIRTVENGTTGTFNAVGPRSRMSMAEQLHGVRAAVVGDKQLRFVWVPSDFLAKQQVEPWSDMPTWFHKGAEDAVLNETNIERAVAAGLTFRPLAVTAADALAWFKGLPAERQKQVRAGIAPDKEQAVLAAWKASAK